MKLTKKKKVSCYHSKQNYKLKKFETENLVKKCSASS